MAIIEVAISDWDYTRCDTGVVFDWNLVGNYITGGEEAVSGPNWDFRYYEDYESFANPEDTYRLVFHIAYSTWRTRLNEPISLSGAIAVFNRRSGKYRYQETGLGKGVETPANFEMVRDKAAEGYLRNNTSTPQIPEAEQPLTFATVGTGGFSIGTFGSHGWGQPFGPETGFNVSESDSSVVALAIYNTALHGTTWQNHIWNWASDIYIAETGDINEMKLYDAYFDAGEPSTAQVDIDITLSPTLSGGSVTQRAHEVRFYAGDSSQFSVVGPGSALDIDFAWYQPNKGNQIMAIDGPASASETTNASFWTLNWVELAPGKKYALFAITGESTESPSTYYYGSGGFFNASANVSFAFVHWYVDYPQWRYAQIVCPETAVVTDIPVRIRQRDDLVDHPTVTPRIGGRNHASSKFGSIRIGDRNTYR